MTKHSHKSCTIQVIEKRSDIATIMPKKKAVKDGTATQVLKKSLKECHKEFTREYGVTDEANNVGAADPNT